ncbi:MAG: GspE/PulE family protein [Armatimonadetes bacterium]|nr:GspE/PulE family protein [Armatimonadota bacterium]
MPRQRLGEFLVARGVLSQQELAAALRAQRGSNKKLGEVLVEQGYLEEDRLTPLLGEFFGLQTFPVDEVLLTPDVLAMVPRPVALKHNIVPVALKENDLLIACSEPVNSAILENLRRLTGKRVHLVLMGSSELAAVRRQAYSEDSGEAAPAVEGPDAPGGAADAIKLLDGLLLKAVAQRASDLHLEPGSDGLRVRLRIDGTLKTVDRIPAAMAPLLISRIKVLCNMNIADRRSPQDGGFVFRPDENGNSTNIRASTLPCAGGEKAVLRLLPSQERLLGIEDLGMEKDVQESFRSLLDLPHGLILVTGPTGSGKTSTLYAALKYLRSDSVNITTVEDPIELQMEGVNQTQVDYSSKKMTFSSALRAILRQDPDIIMVGEIRDGETAGLALQAALTGHLVLSTLHTNDAASAVERLVDMGCERYLVSSALRAVLAQRLVRVICPRCRQKYTPPPEEMLALGLSPGRGEEFYAGKGCAFCQGTGYRGRTGIFELLVLDQGLQKLVAGGADTAVIKEHVKGRMRTLREDGIIKLRRGVATASDIFKATMEW